MTFDVRVLRASAIVVGLVVLVWMLRAWAGVLLLVFAAILFAIFLRGVANILAEKTRLRPGVSLAIVIFALVGLAAGLGFFLAPQLGAQLSEMADVLPQSLDRLQEFARKLPLSQYWLGQQNPNEVLESKAVQSKIPKVFTVTLAGAIQLAFVVVTGIYLAVRPQAYVNGVLQLIPQRRRDRVCQLFGAIGFTLQWWLIGQVIIMVSVGAATAIGLALLGIPLALILGIIAGLLDFIPNVGPIVAAIPGILIALLQGPETAFYVALLYLGIQHLEGYVLTPLIHRQTVSLEPALIISAQFAFGVTMGALGILLATPLVAVALVAIKMLYIEDVLGHKSDVQGADRAGEICASD